MRNNKFLLSIAAAVVLVACENSTSTDPAVDASHNVNVSKAPTPGSREDFKANVGDRVFFAFDRSELSHEAMKTVESQAAWFKTYPTTKAVVAGHCDERGTREYNLALGQHRSNKVAGALASMGVDHSRVRAVSHGKDMALVPGTGEAIWAQNRAAVTDVE